VIIAAVRASASSCSSSSIRLRPSAAVPLSLIPPFALVFDVLAQHFDGL
jgi:hypothetical protein